MARLLLVSCLVACCAALQPSLVLSTRTAQAAQRTAAPVMKRPDYFLRVSRSEAGRPRLCVFRWAVAATNPPWIGRPALVAASVALRISHGRTEQLSFPLAGRPHRLPPPSQLQPRPSQRTPVQPSGRPAHGHSQPSPPAHAMVVAPHIPARQRTRERRPCRASALLPPSSPRFERTHAGRVVRAGRTRTSTRRSSTTARASSSAPPPPRRRAWRPPPPTAANPLPNT